MATTYDSHLVTQEILEVNGNPDDYEFDNLHNPPNSDQMHSFQPSRYYSLWNRPQGLKTTENFNVLSLNTRGMNAKFENVVTF